MKVIKILIVAAVLLTAITPLLAIPDVPTLTVDTLTYLGKTGGGEAGGAFFLPDGNIIALWKGRPLIIDSKSGEVIRNLDALPSGGASEPEITNDGTKLVTKITGPKLAVWDIQSGKIIFQLDKQISFFCLSPDGTKLYVTLRKQDNNPGIIVIYDMNTFQEIERLLYTDLTKAYHIDITPDGQTLAVVVNKYIDSQTSYIEIILINLNDKKNYSLVESYDDGVISLEFSPDGKQITSLYNDGNHTYIYMYDLESKEKNYIREEELSSLFGVKIQSIGRPNFIDNNNILFEVSDWPDTHKYYITWTILNKTIKNYLKFNTNISIDVKDSLILLCNQSGVVAFLNKNIVPVKENIPINESYLKFYNNQLEFYSDKAFIGESTVYDTTGKQIANLCSQPFEIGKNIIQINHPLAIGVYILTIKNGTEQFSYKFLVE